MLIVSKHCRFLEFLAQTASKQAGRERKRKKLAFKPALKV